MDAFPTQPQSLGERAHLAWQRALRLAKRLALAFALSTAAAIGLGALVTDNAFAQILVTALAALAFWIPFLFVVVGIERFVERRRLRRSMPSAQAGRAARRMDEGWSRLVALAPGHSQRLVAVRRSLEQSRLALGKADLDPDAHELCVLIDRRLPELIHSELNNLAPDDRNRGRQLAELVDLVEQFARHCSRRRSGEGDSAGFDAAVLRRRFEMRLTDF